MEEKSYFAPALRSTLEEIRKEYELVDKQKLFNEIFGAITGIGAVIDENRQVVFANRDFLSFIGIESMESILGKRPGEIVSCIHSTEEKSGCGTSVACAYCGAVNAILESQKTGLRTVKETRITSAQNGKIKSLDLNITSSPISLSGKNFYILAFQDISDEKRRLALERIFFHDLLNSAGGLNGLLSILKEGTDPEEARQLIDLSEEASRDILEEIILHRQIRAAEKGELQVKIELVNSIELINSAIGKISSHEVGKNKMIIVSEQSVNINFETDRILLQRVILNLLKNALEATIIDGSVFVGIESKDDKIRIWIKNNGVIPHDVQMQLFQRSFSTKDLNRGIGTYSIKLLTENYLSGKVSFVSNEKEGTVFIVELIKSWSDKI